MKRSQVAPELRASVLIPIPLPVGSAFGRWLLRSGTRLLDRNVHVPGIRFEKRVTASGVPLRLYVPEGRRSGAALLWIHGGGMVIGNAAQDDAFCAEVARLLDLVVVSVDYRLAPEHPFPAPLDDCFAGWSWLLQQAEELQLDLTRLAIGGASAGGGLAASLIQRIADTDGIHPVAQWLFCPMLDDRTAARRELDAIKYFVWTNQRNRTGWQALLNVEPGAASVPEYAVAARRQDLRGLPQAWIGTGDIELFFEEDCAFAQHLQAAGVACVLDVVPGAYHGFERAGAKGPLARAYLERSREWLRQALAITR